MFEEERPHLKALPLLGMQYFEEVQRTVCDDSCVRVDHSSYAARPAAIGSKVRVRIFAQRIQIFDLQTGTLLRSHPKAERPGTVVLDDDRGVVVWIAPGTEVLLPVNCWADKGAYNKSLAHLARLFAANFQRFADGGGHVTPQEAERILEAGPRP